MNDHGVLFHFVHGSKDFSAVFTWIHMRVSPVFSQVLRSRKVLKKRETNEVYIIY